ncbi:MAG TPA: hypothetical protein VG225_12190 [Terracidiphilus sp.]|nr:hypothetical protein [Terracidiphilus sp.]
MSPNIPARRPRKSSEEGYILLGVLILLALFVIAMAATAPRIAADIQRDREVETMHRGKQYIRAIQLYHRKFNAYPPSIDALVKTNEIRFLRKRYIDPTTGKDDWKPIMFCQNKAPLAMGFFGQPLGAAGCGAIAGTGPSGGNGLQGSGMFGGGSTIGGGSVGGPGTSGGPGGGLFSNSPTSPTTGTNTGPGAGPTGGPGSGTTGGSGAPGSTSSTGTTDANGNPTDPTAGQTFGGGGIVGFSPASTRQSILVYKKKNKYNEWEFTYSPLMEMKTIGGGNAGGIGQPIGGQPGQPGSGAGGGQDFGPGGNTGSTPIPPTPSQPPQ